MSCSRPVGPRDLPERQQTMNATVAWSYQLLAPNEQRVFRRLGALPGRFSIEAAAAVLAGREESSGTQRRSAPRGGQPDRQEPPAASRDLGADSSAVPDARNRAGVRGARAHRGGRARRRAGGAGALLRDRSLPSRRRGWSVLRRANGWIACVTISRATAAR